MMWNRTITIYNRYTDNGIPKWKRTVLNNCFVKRTDENRKSGGNSSNFNGYIIRICKNTEYVPPLAFFNFSNKSKVFTLCPDDVIFFGKIDEIPDETISGQRMNDVKSKYDLLGYANITLVRDNTNFSLPHYYVKGGI